MPATVPTKAENNHSFPAFAVPAHSSLPASSTLPASITNGEPPSIVMPAAKHSDPASATPAARFFHPIGPRAVLMITAIAGAESCATSLANSFGVPVEIASTRKRGLAALRHRDYAAVILDQAIAEADPAGTELIWKHSGLAVPLEINFALVGCARLGRELKAALVRREQEEVLALRAATSHIENELRSTVAGLLLNSELALSEPSVPPQIESKLRTVVELAGSLRRQLEQPRL
jgi:hypothetical protein